MASILKNVAGQKIPFLLLSSSSPYQGATGLSVQVNLSKDGASSSGGAGTVTETGSGGYVYSPTQAETNCTCLSTVCLESGGASAIPAIVTAYTDTPSSLGQVAATTAYQTIADFTLRRSMANAESAAESGIDSLSYNSLYGFIQQAQFGNSIDNSGSWTIYKTNGITVLHQLPIVSQSGVNPVVAVGVTT